MFKYIAITFLLVTTFSYASIFHEDDRRDFFEMPDEIKNVSKSSIALVPKNRLIKKGNFYYPKAQTLKERFKTCDDTKFSDQLSLANCSGVLINSNQILTAAHCITKDMPAYAQDKYYIVFNYHYKKEEFNKLKFSEDEVFDLGQAKELYYNFDRTMFKTGIDLAIYELARKPKFPSAKINLNAPKLSDGVHVIGYPLGVAKKLSGDTPVTKLLPKTHAFQHELDTFSVNSGSPIFNLDNEIVGVHVRGTGFNMRKYDGRDCNDWGRGKSGEDYGEANNLTPLKSFYFKTQQ